MVSGISLLEQLISTYLWPLIATTAGVFLGVFLNGVIDAERDRTESLLQPLLAETQQIKSENPNQALDAVLSDDGRYESVGVEPHAIELLRLNPALLNDVVEYLRALNELDSLRVPHLALADVLDQVGYAAFLQRELPDALLLEDQSGVDPTNRPLFPGPALRVGTYTTNRGESAYFEEGYRAPVRTDRRYSVLAFLLEHFDALQTADSPTGLREVVRQSPEMDIDLMDELAPNWADIFWAALHDPFTPTSTIHEKLETTTTSGSTPSPLVVGDSFSDVVRGADLAVKLLRVQQRRAVIGAATQLHRRLTCRLSRRVFNPRRLWVAMWTSTDTSRAATVGQRERNIETANNDIK